jgi:hypothetical protein
VGDGFDKFISTAVVKVMKSIKPATFDRVLAAVEKAIKVPEDRREEVKDVIDMCNVNT